MFRTITNAIRQVEYFFVGDLFRLFWGRINFINELAKSDTQSKIITRRIGLPIPYLHTDIVIVKGSFSAIRKVLGTSREPLEAIDEMIGAKIFFSQTGPEATKKHHEFKSKVILPNLQKVYVATKQHADAVFSEWQASGGQDLRLVISKICLGVVGETMLGLKKMPDETHEVLTQVMQSTANHAFAVPVLSRSENADYQKSKQAMSKLQKTLIEDNKDNILHTDNYIKNIMNEKNEREGGNKTLDQLITDQEILSNGPSTLLASENIASLSMLVIIKLMENNEVMQKLLAEVQDIDCQKLTYAEINKLEYLNYVYMESLRYFSPTSLISRYNKADIKVDENTTIPKGYIFIPISQLHHDAEYWTNPDEFYPERFREEENKFSTTQSKKLTGKMEAEPARFFSPPHNYFMPFSAEARICPGQVAAEIIFKTLMVKLLQNYKLQPKPNQKVDITNDTGTTKLHSPYIVELHPNEAINPGYKSQFINRNH